MNSLRARTCCISGHRDLPARDINDIKQRAENVIRTLYGNGVRFFGVGGAIGFDTLMAQVLFRLRQEEFPDIKIVLVYPFDGFTSRWTDEQKALYRRLLPYYNKVVCVSKEASKGAYLARDRHLVDGSSYCLAYCTKDSGGTAYTIRYAEEHGVKVINIANRE